MEFYSELSSQMIIRLQDAAIMREENRIGRYPDHRAIQRAVQCVRKKIMECCAARLHEMIEGHLWSSMFDDMPNVRILPFTVRCVLGSTMSTLIVTLETAQWREYLSDSGIEQVRGRVASFLHAETIYPESAVEWQNWQHQLEIELINELSKE